MTISKTIKSTYKEIKLSLIDRPEYIARIQIDEKELNELAQSIRQRGLMQAIGVKPKGERFMIIYGDRRFLAHGLLNKNTIMCRIEDIDDDQVVIDRAVENIQRVNLTPFEEAYQYKNLVEKGALTLEQISIRAGKSPGVIQRRLDILKMPESFQKGLHEGKINVAVAEELWACKEESKREYFLELAIEHGITRKIAKTWVDEYKKALRVKKDDVVDGGGDLPPYVEKPIYGACDTCHEAVEYKYVTELRVCHNCAEAISKAVEKTR